MKNDRLYEALCKYGEVRVVNEGLPPVYSCPKAKTFSLSRKQARYATIEDWGETYSMCCPMCGDKRYRFFVSHLYGMYARKNKVRYRFGIPAICHNEHCDVRTWLREHAPLSYSDEKEVPEESIESTDRAAMFTAMSSIHVELPKGCIPLPDPGANKAADYTVSRGFDPGVLYDKYYVMFAPEGVVYEHPTKGFVEMRADRLLIPIMQRRRLMGWQARLLREPAFKNEPKYLSSPGMKKAAILYNMDRALFHTDVVICEGVTDVWRIGEHAMGLLGKVLSYRQMNLLNIIWSWRGTCVVCLDADASATASGLVAYLTKHDAFPGGAAALLLDKGDPGEYTTEEITEKIAEVRASLSEGGSDGDTG